MGKLQTFRFMDGYQAYAVDLVTLNSLGAESLFPFSNKGVDAGGILAGKGEQLVVEGTQIGTLTFQSIKFEEGVKTFRQFVQRQFHQFLKVVDIGFWQLFVERIGAE